MLEIKDLKVAFQKRTILEGVDLTIQNGYIYGLLGKNGVGKSTLLKVISGLIFPDGGNCQVNRFIPRERNIEFLDQLYFLPEEPILPAISITKYLELYRPFYSSYSVEIEKRCLEEFGIDPRCNIKKLSMGERKQVAITFAFAVNTSVLLLDEPTNGLDIPSKSVFRKLMASLMNEQRMVIISTHQVRDLENIIDAVVILDQGRVALSDTLVNIARKIAFRKVEVIDDVLFKQNSPLGEQGAVINRHNDETDVDLELLFQAVITNPQAIHTLFM